MTEHQSMYLLFYTGVVAFAILIQGIALVVLALAAAKLMKQLAELTNEAKGKVYPILESVRDISAKGQDIAEVARNVVRDSEPKIKRVTSNIADTSDVYRAKVAQVDALITDTTGKAQRQSDRVDAIVTSAITKTSETATNIGNAILAPVRQMSGFVSGAKTTIDSLIAQFVSKPKPVTPKPVAFEGESVYTGYEDDYHA
jgi:methyl-accepting chemotaxis protein